MIDAIFSIPRCFTAQQWSEWMAVARMVRPQIRNGFCEDCTPHYQARMILLERCDHPDVRFTFNPEDGTLGRRPSSIPEC